MRLGNILKQAGGTVETGRPVKFQIKVRPGKGTKSTRKWCEAVILPLSEQERAEAIAAARAYCVDHPDANEAAERAIHLIAAFLHDAENCATRFALAEDLPHLRNGLIAPQVAALLAEYDAHVENEYPELLPKRTRAELEAQIANLQKQIAALAEEAAGE